MNIEVKGLYYIGDNIGVMASRMGEQEEKPWRYPILSKLPLENAPLATKEASPGSSIVSPSRLPEGPAKSSKGRPPTACIRPRQSGEKSLDRKAVVVGFSSLPS